METPQRSEGKRILRMDLIWVPQEYMVSPVAWAGTPAFSAKNVAQFLPSGSSETLMSDGLAVRHATATLSFDRKNAS